MKIIGNRPPRRPPVLTDEGRDALVLALGTIALAVLIVVMW